MTFPWIRNLQKNVNYSIYAISLEYATKKCANEPWLNLKRFETTEMDSD